MNVVEVVALHRRALGGDAQAFKEFAEVVRQALGQHPTIRGGAAALGVSRKALSNWLQQYPQIAPAWTTPPVGRPTKEASVCETCGQKKPTSTTCAS